MSHIPIPGTTQHKLIQAGLKRFAEMGYNQAEVDDIAADAGVTVGALYHHYKSKKKFYGLLRDDVTLRILDRMEAVAGAAPPELRLKLVLLTAYDSMIRLKVGRLLSEPDPRKGDNPVARYLGELAAASGEEAGEELGIILAEALRAAFAQVVEHDGDEAAMRSVLNRLLSS